LKLVELENILKVYPNGIVANRYVNFDVRAGEVHALIGDNGAGKTTLMKILAGFEYPTSGVIRVEGRVMKSWNVRKALHNGIVMVHQHFSTVPSLSVLENLILPMRGYFGKARKQAIKKLEELEKILGFQVPLDMKVLELSYGMRQKLEIVKALMMEPRVLILDEPTALLSQDEVMNLFEVVEILKSRGVAVVFISHKLKEVEKIGDRVTMLDKGVKVETFEKSERVFLVPETLNTRAREHTALGEELLKVQELWYIYPCGRTVLKNVSFSVHAGEIVGIYGPEGNGQKELVEILMGLRKYTSGRVEFRGKDMRGLSTADIRRMGISYVPDNKLEVGTAMKGKVWENLVAGIVRTTEFGCLISPRTLRRWARELMELYGIFPDDPDASMYTLSGGNLQKVILARELSSHPMLLIAHSPTKGLDFRTARFVRSKIREIRYDGGVLLISSDLEEISELCDKVYLMSHGELHLVEDLSSFELSRV